MNDEEREAVEYWKTHMKILHLNTQLASEHYIKVLLDLVEKQSKEIEELKKPKYLLNAKTGEITTINNSEFISKDKIKAKIEEYDDKGMTINLLNRSAGKTFQQAVHYEVKKVLQSLLEKE